MKSPQESQSNPELPPEAQWDVPLDERFCDVVFGRPVSPQELEERNWNITIDNFDQRVAALQDDYPEWHVYVYGEEHAMNMKLAVAMLYDKDPTRLKVLFLHQEE